MNSLLRLQTVSVSPTILCTHMALLVVARQLSTIVVRGSQEGAILWTPEIVVQHRLGFPESRAEM